MAVGQTGQLRVAVTGQLQISLQEWSVGVWLKQNCHRDGHFKSVS